MTRRELVKAALEHRPAPRAPYVIDLTAEAWEALQPVAEGKSQEDFLDNDVKDIGVPWWNWHELGPDWSGMEAPTSPARVLGVGSYDGLADNLKALRDTCDKYLLVRLYGTHFEKAYFARGFENFLADMAGDPPFARKLLRRIIEKNLVMMESFLALPEIDGVLLGSDWGSQRGLLMSVETWDEMIRPGEQASYDLIHAYGKDVWIHSCGDIERLIPRLIEMGIEVLNPIQPECMDLGHLKRQYGDELTFWGGISTQQTLPYGTPEEVKEEARRVRNLLSEGGGYILSPSQSIQGDVPVANVLALLEVARG